MSISDSEYRNRIATAWTEHLEGTPQEARELVERLTRTHSIALVAHFYDRMLEQSEASKFLSHEMVADRLSQSLRVWLDEVLGAQNLQSVEVLIERQVQVGHIHARIGVPAHLVTAGARMIKETLSHHLQHGSEPPAIRFHALRFAVGIIDLAIEAMMAAYVDARDNALKEEVSYRYFIGIRHIGLERERQQGALLEWENSTVFQLATDTPIANLTLLSTSPFGLWYRHKGAPIFSRDPKSATVEQLIESCDRAIIDMQEHDETGTAEHRTKLLREIHGFVTQIKHLTQSMFEKIMELESGRDDLTQLLNRRFLPTILRREISLAERSRRPFAVVLVDLDHFKSINDEYGHAAGDLALQAVAAVLLRNLRVSDYAFRYGGEEFLLVNVETDLEGARTLAERLRQEISQEVIRLPGGRSMYLTASFGVALHTGHPDFARMIDAADAALYRAKTLGRNRVEVAQE